MPTVDARLATLEAMAQENRDRIKELLATLNGGGDVDYERSVRGRLHIITTELAAINLRATLLTEVRQERRVTLSGWLQAVLAVCALGTFVAAWYGVLLH